MKEDVGLQREVRWLPEFGDGIVDPPSEVLEVLLGELLCDRNSHPAEVNLDLIPGNALALFGHCVIKSGNVFGVLESFHEYCVAIRAHENRSWLSIALQEDRFTLGKLDSFRELLSGFADCHLCHRVALYNTHHILYRRYAE
jgi:hypothetical protein